MFWKFRIELFFCWIMYIYRKVGGGKVDFRVWSVHFKINDSQESIYREKKRSCQNIWHVWWSFKENIGGLECLWTILTIEKYFMAVIIVIIQAPFKFENFINLPKNVFYCYLFNKKTFGLEKLPTLLFYNFFSIKIVVVEKKLNFLC